MKRLTTTFILALAAVYSYGQSGFDLIHQGKAAGLYYQGKESLVHTAMDMLVEDSKAVAEQAFHALTKPQPGAIRVGVLGEDPEFDALLANKGMDVSNLKGRWEAFQLQVVGEDEHKQLFVVGSDAHGAAYGVLELSRLIGVSPWVWWADVKPERKIQVTLPEDYLNVQHPDVQYRGIFLNDEDWGITPWSAQTYEPDAQVKAVIDGSKNKKMQTIGPKTYSQIFELLLRLRANTIWPAMHASTVPFYFVEGNREASEKYGIYVGSSHCEPLARNSAAEWDMVGEGPYNYLTNKANIQSYWSDRLQELGKSNNIFTMGMRGKHDGKMEGVKTVEEYKNAINRVIVDQTELLKTYINPDPSQIPQVVIPYKEILDVYKAGMQVPEYMTLMWCDDNYGYITHFPDEQEKQRSGGNGLYYHISYWGRPHDYLWLSTMNPGLIYQQMRAAYQHHVRKMWIVNVGDIKPGEYQTELFLDMAWDIHKVTEIGVEKHLENWLQRSFGEQTGKKLLPLMQEHYRLAHIRKPEFMGNTREEEADRAYYRTVRDLPWSEEEVRDRLAAYIDLSEQTAEIARSIPQEQADAFFELVTYPIQGATEMNKKMLKAQLARHGKTTWQESHVAYDKIVELTEKYNALNGGKWKGMMDYRPRRLPVFDRVPEEQLTKPMLKEEQALLTLNGADLHGQAEIIPGLGYEGKAVEIKKGQKLYFDLEPMHGDSVLVEVRLLPTHPVAHGKLRFGIAQNDGRYQRVDYQTKGRSEEWKVNKLRNQAIRRVSFPLKADTPSRIRLTAIDEGVVLDQVKVYPLENKKKN